MKTNQMENFDSAKFTKVRLRHECKTSWVGKVNEKLTDLQKRQIEATPFKWLMWLGGKLKISCRLLNELTNTWIEKRGGFRIRSKIIDFTPLDVCLYLGLRIVGEKVYFEEDLECHTRKLFKSKKVTIELIFEEINKLNSDDDVDDFCRLYILLGLAEFYFLNTTGIVNGGLFKVLDNLQSVGKYNWGVAVYDYLVDSLSRASLCLHTDKNSSQLHIKGCAVLLQIWALEHSLIYPKRTSTRVNMFPRILKWFDVSISHKNVGSSFNGKAVIEVLCVSSEEVAHEYVREALEHASSGYPCWKNDSFDKKLLMAENELLLASNKNLEGRIARVEEELRVLKELCRPYKGSSSSIGNCTIKHEAFNYSPKEGEFEGVEMNVQTEDEAEIHLPSELRHVLDCDTSNMYTRLKEQPRKRVRSLLIQTPWTTYARKKNKKQVI